MLTMRRRAIYTPPIKLDLGCGTKKREGYVGLDRREHGQDVLWDVRHGLPFSDNSVEEILAHHFLEHVGISDLDDLFYEMWRVCKHEAVVKTVTPLASHKTALYVCHDSLWDEKRIYGICEGLRNAFSPQDVRSTEKELFATLKINKQMEY